MNHDISNEEAMEAEMDPRLQALFAEAQPALDGEAFTTHVIARARTRTYRTIAAWTFGGLLLAILATSLSIPLELAQMIGLAMTTSLVDLGSGWLGFLASPINNIGALLILCIKGIRVVRKKVMGAPFAF